MEKNRIILEKVHHLSNTVGGGKIKERILDDIVTKSDFREYLRKESTPYNRMMAYYRCALMEVETKFRVLNEDFSLEYDRNPINYINARLKSTDSILEKVERRGLHFNVPSIEANIYDIAGIRIVCAFLEDIYFLEECLLKQDDITLIQRKDYIANPKENGYRSLHLIIEIPIFLHDEKKLVKVEIQLRTIAMDFWASLEHRLKYKKELPEDIDMQEITDQLKMCASISSKLDEDMDEIRRKIGY